MISPSLLRERISLILLIGTLLSLIFVLVGSSWFLYDFGQKNVHTILLTTDMTNQNIWQLAFSFTPLGFIDLGLLILVMTQLTRVGLLVWFYSAIKDYWFMLVSGFIFCVLLYSFFWQLT